MHSQIAERYRCTTCGQTFAAITGNPYYCLRTAADLVTVVLTLVCNGCPLQAIVAAFGLDERTVAAWVTCAGRHYQQVHQHLVQQGQMGLQHVQADELWVKLVGLRVWMAMAMAVQRQSETGLEELCQGMAAVLATGNTLSRPFCLVLLAEAAGHVGLVDEGLRLLAETRMAVAESGRSELLAEVYRLQGVLLLRQVIPDAAQAEACFQQALAIARQQAKSWELRAAMSLARLWQRQGKRDEAHALLAPIYGWCTEGFDTADLREAQALLEELSTSS